MLTKSQKHGLSPEIHTEYNLITINYWLLQISGPQILIYSPGTFFAPEQSPRGDCAAYSDRMLGTCTEIENSTKAVSINQIFTVSQ